MELGMIGLGRMGGNMAERLLREGHRVVGYDPVPETLRGMEEKGVIGAASIAGLVAELGKPRSIWLMVPSGEPTESTIKLVAGELSQGDTVVDGGNSYYRDSVRRAAELADRDILFLDVGTSAGIWGLEEGYCLMVGGDIDAYRRLEPVFQTLAPSSSQGYGHVGLSGAGHFVKMVHNGIEYGLMEAYAEGFELMKAKSEYDLDLAGIAEVWRYGSVIRSWLLDLAAAALREDPMLEGIQAYVEDTGEGRWTVQESIDLAVPVPAISQSLQARFRSRQEQPFGGKLLAALRKQFGGHVVREAPRREG